MHWIHTCMHVVDVKTKDELTSRLLLLLSVNRLGAFEVEKVHHINVVDTGFVPRTWCLEILRDTVLLKLK